MAGDSADAEKRDRHDSDSDRTKQGEDGERKPGNGEGSSQGEYEAEDLHGDDEYSVLLRYVKEAAAKKKQGGGDNEDGTQEKTKRIWYMPWKTKTITLDKHGDPVEANHTRSVPPALLETQLPDGLPEADVDRRRSDFGWNELESSRENVFFKFLSFFKGPILYVMELAVALAGGLRDWIDFGVIIAILGLNAFVGFYQEKKAGDIVEKLKGDIALKATVLRGGQEKEVLARELVPGDIVIIDEGQTIPGDGIIIAEYTDKDGSKAKAQIEKNEEHKKQREKMSDEEKEDDANDRGHTVASVDQSAITGESLAVDKYLGDTVYYTTGNKRGKCYVRVTATGLNTFVGRTASLVSGANRQGHFQIVMNSIGATLLFFVIAFGLAFWIGSFFRNIPIATGDNNILVFTLAFMIIGVPVGLPCVTTTTLAVGASFLARRQAIVQRLTAIEALAGVDILCSDKTGTLTANKLSIEEPFTSEGVDVNWMMCVAVLASSHNVKSLDPIDKVTVETLKNYPKAQEMLRQGWHTRKFSPFDPKSKRITAEVTLNGKDYTAAKGAPNAILKLCGPDKQTADDYRSKTVQFAKRGFRTLGVAIEEDGKWKLLGLLPMFDPPRGDTRSTLMEAKELGVPVKMLTGDAVAIAVETCAQLGLGQNVYNSQSLISGEGMSGSDVHDFVEAADGFGEVFPEHKYQVVQYLQDRGHLVAMTGDGVNDAPSLKLADCGIAVEGASDAARAAADVVFLDEGLSTIVLAIKTSRQIFARMKAYIIYRIALCLHLEIFLLLQILINGVIIPIDLIVFLALFADVATLAIAYDNAAAAPRPVEWQLPKIWIMSTIMGIGLAAGTWILRGTLYLDNGGIIENFGQPQSILFLEISLTENWLIFITRTGQGDFTWPSWQLVGAILGVDAISTIFCLFGWLNGPDAIIPAGGNHHPGWTDIVTVVKVWGYSFAVVVVLGLIYFILNRITWLENLGRQKRGHKNTQLEDFMVALQRVTIVHKEEESSEGHKQEVYRFGQSAELGAGKE